MQQISTNTKLIEDLHQGNEFAFAEIFNQYHNAVLSNIRKLIADQQEAEDILQEVFIALWNNRQKLTISHSVAGWLFRASYYKALEHIKKAVRQSISPFTDEFNDVFSFEEDNYLLESDYTDKLSILNAAIELLPPQKKLAFKLCRLEGKTYEEIASALNISVASAKDYVKSASKLLKKSILAKNASTPSVGFYFLALFLQG